MGGIDVKRSTPRGNVMVTMEPDGKTPSDSTGMLNIGVVSKATGIPVETLRTWERRYGYPQPHRTDSGHRLYKADCVDRLKAVARAIELGHRASCVVPMALDELDALLGITVGTASADPWDVSAPRRRTAHAHGSRQTGAANAPPFEYEDGTLGDWMRAVRDLDEPSLDRLFRMEWARLGTVRFLTECAGPMMELVGCAWNEGHLSVGHEHFASERMRDFLAGIWRPLSERAPGGTVVCATLPTEQHHLGLHMATAVAVLAGHRAIFLGSGAPTSDIAIAARQAQSKLVVVSVSLAMEEDVTRHHLAELRRILPEFTTVVAGGAGCPRVVEGLPVQGVVTPGSLPVFWDWLRQRADRGMLHGVGH